MASILKVFNRILGLKRPATQTVGPDLLRFAEGDRVLIDGKRLSGPLRVNQRTDLPRGYLAHNDIIGKRPRALLATNVGQRYRVTFPDFDQYTALTPRKVTPVYSSYASLIVSILDIHVAAPAAPTKDELPLEILESGTGHGALTLHLARAIHAANPPPPPLPPPLPASPVIKATSINSTTRETPQSSTIDPEEQQSWAAYRASRRAILHSVEILPMVSSHAMKLVHGFRRGIYAAHVDFHVAPITEWIRSQFEERNRSVFHKQDIPFLSAAVLDMPGVHQQVGQVARAMKPGAMLIVFVPSITQVGDCVRTIQENQIDLQLEKVLELGEGISNGRVWDVRLAKKRAHRARNGQSLVVGAQTRGPGVLETPVLEDNALDEKVEMLEPGEEDVDGHDEPVMVCRPKVGRMTIGGGFLGIWRKADAD